MTDNYGFTGAVSPGASVADNIFRGTQYQATHTPQETFDWFYEHVRNNKDGHLPPNESMDYKQIIRSIRTSGTLTTEPLGVLSEFQMLFWSMVLGGLKGKRMV